MVIPGNLHAVLTPFLLRLPLLLSLLASSSIVFAEEARVADSISNGKDVVAVDVESEVELERAVEPEDITEDVIVSPDDSAIVKFFAKSKRKTENRGNRAVQWVDSFFSDPEYEIENASTQFRIRPELYIRKEQGVKARLKGSFKIQLPNLKDKVSLYAGTSDYDSNFDQAVDDDIQDPMIGLQFVTKQSGKWNTSMIVGLKGSDFAAFAGPRISYRTDLSRRKSFRFTQKILWQTNSEWDIRSRLDFNWAVKENYFFRQMIDGRWRGEYSDQDGYRTRVSSFLTRKLGDASGLQTEVSLIFKTEPDSHLDEYVIAWRYRKRSTVDWLYYEIVPILSWEDQFDFEFNPGIRLRLEIFYGTDKSKRYWRRVENSQDFRW